MRGKAPLFQGLHIFLQKEAFWIPSFPCQISCAAWTPYDKGIIASGNSVKGGVKLVALYQAVVTE